MTYPVALREDPAIREKWDSHGRARRHYGSTFVCEVVTDSPLYELGLRMQDEVVRRGIAHNYGMLPPSSYHMTVADGLKLPLYVGQADRWPAELRDLPFTEAASIMRQRLVEAAIPAPKPLEMAVTGVHPLEQSLTVLLGSATSEVAAELSRFRNAVYDALGMNVADVDGYQFHMSLGYRLTEPDAAAEPLAELYELFTGWAAEVERADLEPVGFCVFADMYSFPQILRYS
ncbi:MAG: DUF1868 domain-containing protein [Microbacteriaceae bacterium]|nr:DUF1868 domain-containing protein [Microbacteriaceae bacterium]